MFTEIIKKSLNALMSMKMVYGLLCPPKYSIKITSKKLNSQHPLPCFERRENSLKYVDFPEEENGCYKKN